MTDTGAASLSVRRQAELDEILGPAARARATTVQKEEVKAQDTRFAQIQSNAFFKASFDTSLSPEQKVDAIAELLVATDSKEKDRENAQAYDLFKEYLQDLRKQMQQKIIQLSDTKNFSVLHDSYTTLDEALNAFEGDIKPLTETIDALYELRKDGVTLTALDEIRNDTLGRAELDKKKADLKARTDAAEFKIAECKASIAELGTKKTLFGFGGIQPRAAAERALKEAELSQLAAELEPLAQEAAALQAPPTSTELTPAQIKAKEVLRSFLNSSSPEHEERSKRLIAAGLDFIKTSDEKLATIRDHLGSMDKQIVSLGDNSYRMAQVYALLDDGIKKAETKNLEIRDNLQTTPVEESTIARLSRDEKSRNLDEHITYLAQSAKDTTQTIGELTEESIQIKNMKDSTANQTRMARDMNSRGVASVASRISVVLTALGSAALSEAGSMSSNTLRAMTDSTNKIAMKESMRTAMGINAQNEDLQHAIDSLEKYGIVTQQATQLTKDGLAQMRDNLQNLEKVSTDVAKGVQDSYGAMAESIKGAVEPEVVVSMPKDSTTLDPFNIGKV